MNLVIKEEIMRGDISVKDVAEKVKENGLEHTILYDIKSCDIEDEDLSSMWLEAKAVMQHIEEYFEKHLSQQY